MENITDVSIHVDDHAVMYHVSFTDGVYRFTAKEPNVTLPSFSFCREHGEWVPQQSVDEKIRTQAERHLERYLLSQH